MSISKKTINTIGFPVIQKYLQSRNWEKKKSKRNDLAIFFIVSPEPTEILLPLDRDLIDYEDLIFKAISKISKVEDRDFEQIINDLLLPPSDIIRFRAVNKRTEHGLITFGEGFTLIENAKKSLFLAAYDIVHPSLYHKGTICKEAQQFIDSCFLGQTERGSYIASVVCPFVNKTEGEKPTQLSLFNNENELVNSFTRRVTKQYMKSLSKLKTVIESGNYESLENEEEADLISANFIESIVELGEYGDKEEIEIYMSWSSHAKEALGVPRSISFTKDYISPMESIISKLKPKEESIEGTFVGKVSKAQASTDPNTRMGGEITFDFIGNEDKIVKAKVFLNNDNFSQACNALDKGNNIKVSGKLIKSGKTRIIENAQFCLI